MARALLIVLCAVLLSGCAAFSPPKAPIQIETPPIPEYVP